MRHAIAFKMKEKGSLLRHKPRWQQTGAGTGDQNTLGFSPGLSRWLASIREWLFLRWEREEVQFKGEALGGSFLSFGLLQVLSKCVYLGLDPLCRLMMFHVAKQQRGLAQPYLECP